MDVTLSGFNCLPPDTKIKVHNPLPEGTSCSLCLNVVPCLLWDPDNHPFCEGCIAMATNGGTFECPNDEKEYPFAQLRKDSSIEAKLKGQLVICPNSTEEIPVKIPFSALKAHLRSPCSCGMLKCPLCGGSYDKSYLSKHLTDECSEGPTSCHSCGEEVLRKNLSSHEEEKHKVQPKLPVASVRKSAQLSSSANLPVINTQHCHSPSRQSSATDKVDDKPAVTSPVTQAAIYDPQNREPKSRCPYCNEEFPKRFVFDHVKQKLCNQGTSWNDASNSVPQQAPVVSVQQASPAGATPRGTKRFNENYCATSPGITNPQDMEMRLAKTEVAIQDMRKQQETLRKEVDVMVLQHKQCVKDDKDEVVKNMVNLLTELTEEQEQGKQLNSKQMEQLKENNAELEATVATLNRDLDMLREELVAVRLLLRAKKK